LVYLRKLFWLNPRRARDIRVAGWAKAGGLELLSRAY